MAIVADIYDLPAAEFLLMLSMNRKTGKLTAVGGEHKVMVAFRDGSIVYAASTAVRERLGSILVSRRLISEEQLEEALRRHKADGHTTHLGNVLVQMGVITDQSLSEVVGSQFQKVVEEMLAWTEGMITFTRMEIPDLGAVHVNPRDILTDMGFDTEQLVIGGMSVIEDSGRVGEAHEAEARTMIRSMMEEMETLSVGITAEATIAILGGAAEVVKRAVLMIVGPDSLRGAGGNGVELEGLSSEEVVRHCLVPRSQDSIFEEVIHNQESFVGELQYNPCHGLFVDQLGGAKPDGVVLVPLIHRGEVVAVLYGDNAPNALRLDNCQDLDLLMARVSASLSS